MPNTTVSAYDNMPDEPGWYWTCHQHAVSFHAFCDFLNAGIVSEEDLLAWHAPLWAMKTTYDAPCTINLITFIQHFNISREVFQEMLDAIPLMGIYIHFDLDVLYSGDMALIEEFYSIENEMLHAQIEWVRWQNFYNERMFKLQQEVFANTSGMSRYFHDIWTWSNFSSGTPVHYNWARRLIDAGEIERVNIVEFANRIEMNRPVLSKEAFIRWYNHDNLGIFTHYNIDVIFSGNMDLIMAYYSIENEHLHTAQVRERFEAYVEQHGMPDVSWMVDPVIRSSNLPTGQLGVPFDYTIQISGIFPVTLSLVSGSLPPGMRFDASTGRIWDSPAAVGEFTFTIEASNQLGSVERDFTVTINSPPAFGWPVIITTELPVFDTAYYPYTLQYVLYIGESDDKDINNLSPVWEIVNGALPEGMYFLENGIISGYPTFIYPVYTTYTFTVQAQNNVGTTTRTFAIVISPLRFNLIVLQMGEGVPPRLPVELGLIGLYEERRLSRGRLSGQGDDEDGLWAHSFIGFFPIGISRGTFRSENPRFEEIPHLDSTPFYTLLDIYGLEDTVWIEARFVPQRISIIIPPGFNGLDEFMSERGGDERPDIESFPQTPNWVVEGMVGIFSGIGQITESSLLIEIPQLYMPTPRQATVTITQDVEWLVFNDGSSHINGLFNWDDENHIYFMLGVAPNVPPGMHVARVSVREYWECQDSVYTEPFYYFVWVYIEE